MYPPWRRLHARNPSSEQPGTSGNRATSAQFHRPSGSTGSMVHHSRHDWSFHRQNLPHQYPNPQTKSYIRHRRASSYNAGASDQTPHLVLPSGKAPPAHISPYKGWHVPPRAAPSTKPDTYLSRPIPRPPPSPGPDRPSAPHSRASDRHDPSNNACRNFPPNHASSDRSVPHPPSCPTEWQKHAPPSRPDNTSNWSGHPDRHAHPNRPSSSLRAERSPILRRPLATPRADNGAHDHKHPPRKNCRHYNNIVYKTHTNPPRPASAKATPCASWPKAWARRSPHRAVASSSAHGCPSPPTYGSRVRAHRRSRPTHLPHRPTIVPAPDRDNPYSCLASSHTRYGPNGSKAHSGRDRRNGKRQ